MMQEQAYQPETASTESPPQELGKRLRRAREARNLSQQEVAAHMHLHMRIIEALEADDYVNLPAPIYVRGYIRSYAKLLQLDGDALVAIYDDDAGHDPRLTPPLKPPPQASSSDKPVKAMTYLLSLTLVLLLLAWWQSRHIGYFDDMPDLLVDAIPEPVDTTGEPELVLLPGLDYPISVVRHPDTPVRAQRDHAPAATKISPLPTTPAEDAEPVALLPIDATPATAAIEDEPAPERPDTAPALKLELSAESWVEVYDAAGKRLYHGLGRPGDTLQFNGEPPYRVVLGYAPGVKVSYHGESFNPEPHSSAGVARFQIGD